jgi:hypothetical protein
MLRILSAAFIVSAAVVFVAPSASNAAETGWLPVIVARGDLKQEIESTPIVDRPNRPFHFYGNTVRRRYYRGAAVPRAENVVNGGSAPVLQSKQN